MKSYMIFIIVTYLFFKNILLILRRVKKNYEKRKYNYKNISTFNLGSSHSYWSFLTLDSLKHINLAHSSQTFYYDKIMLEKFLNKTNSDKVNKICFLTISYFSFSANKLWQNQDIVQYYYPLSLEDFENKEKLEYILYNYLPIIYNFKRKIKEKLKKKKINKTEAEIIEKRIIGHVKRLKEINNREFNLKLLQELIERCQKNSIKVVLLTTPFRKEYNNYFSQELLEKNFYNIIEKIAQKYSLRYLDFSHDYINFNKKEYFKEEDYDHLSLEGSKILMKLLEKNLNIKLLE